MAKRKTAKKRTSSRSTKSRSSSSKTRKKASKKATAAVIPEAMPRRDLCLPCEPKWAGLCLFFLGALILLNNWKGWTNWPVFIGSLTALYGLWYYYKFG